MWKALILDDEKENRELLAEILKKEYHCDLVANSQDALESFHKAITKKAPYDIVLLDIRLPQATGIDVLQGIRKHEKDKQTAPTPVIIISAYKEPFMDSFNMDCDDYVLKPVDPERLLLKMKNKLAKKGPINKLLKE